MCHYATVLCATVPCRVPLCHCAVCIYKCATVLFACLALLCLYSVPIWDDKGRSSFNWDLLKLNWIWVEIFALNCYCYVCLFIVELHWWCSNLDHFFWHSVALGWWERKLIWNEFLQYGIREEVLYIEWGFQYESEIGRFYCMICYREKYFEQCCFYSEGPAMEYICILQTLIQHSANHRMHISTHNRHMPWL